MRKRVIFRPVRRIGIRELVFCFLELVTIYLLFAYSRILLGVEEGEVLCQLAMVLTGASSIQFIVILLNELGLYWGVAGINRYPAYIALCIHFAIGVSGFVVSLHYFMLL
jgi:hypothetical protein